MRMSADNAPQGRLWESPYFRNPKFASERRTASPLLRRAELAAKFRECLAWREARPSSKTNYSLLATRSIGKRNRHGSHIHMTCLPKFLLLPHAYRRCFRNSPFLSVYMELFSKLHRFLCPYMASLLKVPVLSPLPFVRGVPSETLHFPPSHMLPHMVVCDAQSLTYTPSLMHYFSPFCGLSMLSHVIKLVQIRMKGDVSQIQRLT